MTVPTFPIARLPHSTGLAFLPLFPEIQYEWFYAEVFSRNQHAVFIFSLADPFSSAQQSAPASCYFTWYDKHGLRDYSYCFFKGEQAKDFSESVRLFFEGKISFLAVTLPSHSGSHGISFRLENPPSLQNESPHKTQILSDSQITKTSLGKENSTFADTKENFASQNLEYFKSQSKEGIRHFWQPLCLGYQLKGHIFQVPDAGKAERVNWFFDVPTRTKLASQFKSRPRHWVLEDEKGAGAWSYCDHNFGTEFLKNLSEPWFWWHVKGQKTSEIGYWFPSLSSGYLSETSHFPSDFTHSTFGTLCVSHRQPVSALTQTFFGVQVSKSVQTQEGSFVTFPKTIESAPFYARLGCAPSDPSPRTLEALHPHKLRSQTNEFLMGARQMNLKKSPQAWGSALFLEICRRATARNGRSFYLASHILEPRLRAGAYFLYTLCRIIDDATDSQQGPGASQSALLSKALYAPWPEDSIEIVKTNRQVDPLSPSEKLQAVKLVQDFLDQQGLIPENFDGNIRQLSEVFLWESCQALRHFSMERQHFEELIAGQRMDEEHRQPANFDEFYLYCYRVAGVVGLLMAHILGVKPKSEALKAAEHLGIAMQITNILRDVREDYEERRRIYLPKDVFSENFEIFLNSPQPKDLQLIRALAHRGVEYYRNALRGVPAIPTWRGRMCVRLMAGIYGAILGSVLCHTTLALQKRTVIPVRKRFFIALQILMGRSPLKAAGLSNRLPVIAPLN
jgi:phytoene/squalene synthetase